MVLRQLAGHVSAWTIPTPDKTAKEGNLEFFKKSDRKLSVSNIPGLITEVKIDLIKIEENEIKIKILSLGNKLKPFINGAKLKFIIGNKSQKSKGTTYLKVFVMVFIILFKPIQRLV